MVRTKVICSQVPRVFVRLIRRVFRSFSLRSYGCVCVTWLCAEDTHILVPRSKQPDPPVHSGAKQQLKHDHRFTVLSSMMLLNFDETFVLFPGTVSAEDCCGRHFLACPLAYLWQWESTMLCQHRERGGRWRLWLKDLVACSGLSAYVPHDHQRTCLHHRSRHVTSQVKSKAFKAEPLLCVFSDLSLWVSLSLWITGGPPMWLSVV